MRFLVLVLVAVTLLLPSCTAERVVLLPGESGDSGGVAILSQAGEEKALLDQPYTQARIRQGGQATVSETNAETVERSFGALLQALPAPPSTFTLYFKEGTTSLTPESEPELDKLFAEVSARPGPDVQVVGHTDSVGKLEDNDRLSLARAKEIKRLLIERGLDASLVRAVGRGERELLVETDDEVGEPRNRRVEIVVR